MSRPWSSVIGAACYLLAGIFAGCDLPPEARHDNGPRVLRITPDLSAGPIDRAVSIRIDLDRRLAPVSIPQGVVEITSNDVYQYMRLEIDVVRPALIATAEEPLDPDVDYTFVLHSLRDLEGNRSGDTMPIVFHTSSESHPRAASMLTYDDIAPTFRTCGGAGCHASTDAAAGLDLSSREGVRASALGVAARGVAPSYRGAIGVTVNAALLGIARIDPHSPASSYLLYTMLDDEHIAGAPMPPTGEPANEAEMQRLQEWIQSGAPGL